MTTMIERITTPAPSLSLSRADVGLLLARLMAGGVFFYHGSQKLFGWFGGSGLVGFAGYLESLGAPLPGASAFAAAVSEVAGALVLLSGRGFLGLWPLIFTMAVATVTSSKNGFDVQRSGAEFPLAMLLLLISLALTGPGALVIPSRSARGGAR